MVNSRNIMHKSLDNFISIEKEIQSKINKSTADNDFPKIIAISKTFPIQDIYPIINHGHNHFGENKVQEALEKWAEIKKDFKNLKLHMVGKLQTNKVKYAIELFDYIHSLDNLKLAEKISAEQIKKKKKLKIFIQVNIGDEEQKSGISPEKVEEFYDKCVQDLNLDIIGLMCLPPNDKNSNLYFAKMKSLKEKISVPELSMGMSGDYLEAINNGATFVRIGSKLFGDRN